MAVTRHLPMAIGVGTGLAGYRIVRDGMISDPPVPWPQVLAEAGGLFLVVLVLFLGVGRLMDTRRSSRERGTGSGP